MTRLMYDSVTPSAIPTTAAMVAGYVDGRYAWSAADWARWGTGTVKVRIAVFPSTSDGHVLDCETGDATPDQCPPWVLMRRRAGVDPTVYCSEAWWPYVINAFKSQGVPEPHYWVAAYPGPGPVLYPGSVAHQHTDAGGYDLSVVADYWPGVDAPQGGPVTPDEILQLLNYPIQRQGAGQTGTTSLLAMAAWSDAQITAMHADVATVRTEVDTKISSLISQVVAPNVDLDALATKVAVKLAAQLKNAVAAELAERLGTDPNPND
jgi:hypothetical protein